MLVLPNKLAALARHTSANGPRFGGVAGVKLDATDDGYTAVVTDCKVLVRVAGGCGRVPTETEEAMKAAPNGATTAVIPGEVWKKAFPGGKGGWLANLAVSMSEKIITLGANGRTSTTPPVEGRFPPVDQIFPKRPPAVTFGVDPKLVGEMFLTLHKLGCNRADLTLYRHPDKATNTPISFAAITDDLERVDGVFMPMGERDDAPGRADGPSVQFYATAIAAANADDAAPAADRSELIDLRADNAVLGRRVAELERQVRDAGDLDDARAAKFDEWKGRVEAAEEEARLSLLKVQADLTERTTEAVRLREELAVAERQLREWEDAAADMPADAGDQVGELVRARIELARLRAAEDERAMLRDMLAARDAELHRVRAELAAARAPKDYRIGRKAVAS